MWSPFGKRFNQTPSGKDPLLASSAATDILEELDGPKDLIWYVSLCLTLSKERSQVYSADQRLGVHGGCSSSLNPLDFTVSRYPHLFITKPDPSCLDQIRLMGLASSC